MKKILILTLFTAFCFHIFPQNSTVLQKAEEAFLNGKLDEAKSLYLNALKTSPADANIYLNLGFIYEKNREYQTAISYYQKGIPYAGTQLGTFYKNIGNSYYFINDFENAEKMYSSGISSVPPSYSCYFHRGNTRVKLGMYEGAVDDYQTFLTMQPDTPQRVNIELMIERLQYAIDNAEAIRLAEEAKRLEEEERQRKLLESVLGSLEEVSDETKNLSAESDEVESTEVEIDIVD